MTETRKFETETCSRCGGSGHYSYCQMHGTTCFKCDGKRVVYTARALAAIEWMRDQRSVRAGDVKVGDRVMSRGLGKWTVREIKDGGDCKSLQRDGTWKVYSTISLNGEKLGLTCSPDYKLERWPTAAEKNAQILAALDYQDTLTKAGTHRKRKAKEGV